jgi:integrase
VGVPVQGGRPRLDPSTAWRVCLGTGRGEALERELERLRREQRVASSLTLGQLVEAYLEQHDVDPVTIEKLRWLLGRAVAVFGERPVRDLRSEEIAAWRIALSPGYRFDATQALRQVLARAVLWGLIDVNPAKLGVDNPSPRRREQRPFESWAELYAVAANLASRYRPMVIFAAATGLRPAEWLALERRDIDRQARVVYVRRSFTKGRLKCTKTEASVRAVPLQAIALDALERQPASPDSPLLFPAERGGYLDLHNFRNREWKPAQRAAGIEPKTRSPDGLEPSTLSVPCAFPSVPKLMYPSRTRRLLSVLKTHNERCRPTDHDDERSPRARRQAITRLKVSGRWWPCSPLRGVRRWRG